MSAAERLFFPFTELAVRECLFVVCLLFIVLLFVCCLLFCLCLSYIPGGDW